MNERAIAKVEDFQKCIEDRRGDLQSFFKDKTELDRFIRVSLNAAERNPDLKKCTPSSFYLAALAAAEMRLDLGAQQECAIVLQWNTKKGCYEAVLRVMYRGLIRIWSENCGVKDIWTDVVYECDDFEEEAGLNPRFRHVKSKVRDREKKPIVGAYAVALFENGHKKFKIIRSRDARIAKAASPAAQKKAGPWCNESEAEMWEKTALHRLAKTMPKRSERLARAVLAEDDAVAATQDSGSTVAIPTTGRHLIAPPKDVQPEQRQGAEEPHTDHQEQPEPIQKEPEPVTPPKSSEKSKVAEEKEISEPQDTKSVEVTIVDVKRSASEPGAKKEWERFGVQAIDDDSKQIWFNTFDPVIGAAAQEFNKSGATVEISYTERSYKGKDGRGKISLEIVAIRKKESGSSEPSADKPDGDEESDGDDFKW